MLQEFLKHAVTDYLVRALTSIPLDCQIKTVMTANATIVVWCESIKTPPTFLSDWQNIYIFSMPQNLSNKFICAIKDEKG